MVFADAKAFDLKTKATPVFLDIVKLSEQLKHSNFEIYTCDLISKDSHSSIDTARSNVQLEYGNF